ncbi:hypothetical protein JTB14_010097 [Gonioctena quinquepunctata]|nr:hypothetical protein JTB14_010097 [Gonioctena quinquepunctata]
MDKLKKFQTFRKTCLCDISVINSLADRAKIDKTVRTLFKVRCVELEDIKEEFLKQHDNVVSALLVEATADFDAENTIHEGFLSEYYFIKGVYSDLFESDAGNASSMVLIPTMHPSSGSSSHIKLQKIELIEFYGDYKSFPSYLDLYDALIHNNVSLSAIEKFNYLISSLHGPSLSLVRTLSLTTDNYTIAYDALVRRHSNSRLRAQALWSELDNAPKVNSDNVSNLRKLLDNNSENLAVLKQMKFPTDSWDFLLLMMLLKRLDHGIVTRFELKHGSSSIPKYIDLTDFLEKHRLALDTIDVSPPFGQAKRNNYNINSAGKSHSNNTYSTNSRTSAFLVNNSSSTS